MGAVISALVGIVALFAAGVASSIAAVKSEKCGEGRMISIAAAIGEFAVAVVLVLITLFLF